MDEEALREHIDWTPRKGDQDKSMSDETFSGNEHERSEKLPFDREFSEVDLIPTVHKTCLDCEVEGIAQGEPSSYLPL